MDFWSINEQTLILFEVCRIFLDGVYIITSVCGCVHEGKCMHAIMPSKRGFRILLSGLPLKYNLCECKVLSRECK